MQFTKLRLSGFKSFVDPAELAIKPGLTGVVGPNGCGKSNLVEALRWVMGENSAKRMRGGAMDDVIFNGSQNRSSRNLAEVSLTIENRDRSAPSNVNDTDELEVVRAIERNVGSNYRINGNETRARDVQLLFADAASGAHSSSLISQGRIGEIINAKPQGRRILLEEAAGITGLHSRRHEAELRLGAAENNLERLDDVMQALEVQLQNMKRQARQARRFRKIGEQIRQFDGIRFCLLFQAAEKQLAAAGGELGNVNALVARLTKEAAQANTAHEEASALLPNLRQEQAACAAVLHNLAVSCDGLDQEEQRIADALQQLEERLRQIKIDQERENQLGKEASASITQFELEAKQIRVQQEDEVHANLKAEERVKVAKAILEEGECALEELTKQFADGGAKKDALRRAIAAASERIDRLSRRQEEASIAHVSLLTEIQDDEGLRKANDLMSKLNQNVAQASSQLERAENDHSGAERALTQAAETNRRASVSDAQLEAEERALSELLFQHDPDLWSTVIESISVPPGYEAALGAALGDDLNVPMDLAAPVHWRTLELSGDPPELPSGAVPLSRYVKAPDALNRRLSQIGVVEQADADRMSRELAYGQRLVSCEGGLWRWDGFTVTAGAETAAAVRLAQGNRLAELRQSRSDLLPTLEKTEKMLVVAKKNMAEAERARSSARMKARLTQEELDGARDAHAQLEMDTAARSARLVTLKESLSQTKVDLAETEGILNDAKKQLVDLPALDEMQRKQVEARTEVDARRTEMVEARSWQDRLQGEAVIRADRLNVITNEQERWLGRAQAAKIHLAELADRAQAGHIEMDRLRRQPTEIANQRRTLLAQLNEAEKARNQAAEVLTQSEDKVVGLAGVQRRLEGNLAITREERARAEAGVEQCEERRMEVTQRILETLDCVPGAVLSTVGVGSDENLPSLEDAERKLERLRRERDNMGAVNLRAEQEVSEFEEQLSSMIADRRDLAAAISRLRQGIYSLNKEGRERLLRSFTDVDGHFQDLFVRIFGGGKAHLSLTESDDPLEAGLEIMASPPGKRLQNLSLLSGGEQAMTALALHFAVFLTNPAPVCVLDEVDAPLDDTNVERFTSLVGEIADITGTRFMIITHHPYTMARMDRLFGVTMSERGVSQLLSIDLDRAERIRATA